MFRVPIHAWVGLAALELAGCRARLPVDRVPTALAAPASPSVAPSAVAAVTRVEYFQISDG